MIKFEKHIENEQLEVALTRGIELTKELKQEIREIETDTRYKYHYIYSYTIDTSEIENIIHDECTLYVGEGEKTRLNEVTRDFNKTKLYKELVEAGAIIIKRLERVYRTINMDLDLKSIAKESEKRLIKGLSPIFNKEHNDIHQFNRAIENNNLNIIVKNSEVIKIGYSEESTEIKSKKFKDSLGSSSVGNLKRGDRDSVKGFKFVYQDNLDLSQKIFVNFFLTNSKVQDFKEILNFFKLNANEYLLEI